MVTPDLLAEYDRITREGRRDRLRCALLVSIAAASISAMLFALNDYPTWVSALGALGGVANAWLGLLFAVPSDFSARLRDQERGAFEAACSSEKEI